MTKYTPPSIKGLGLKKFLDESATKHRGLGYREFITLYDAGVNLTNLARAFNVSRPTVVYWIDIHVGEHATAKK